MGIGFYLRQIGRGKRGARALSREQAADLMAQVLDGTASDLEIGGFCLAMRIKGETRDELLGFLDALAPRSMRLPASDRPLVVLPSYNGARKLPALTPLLALLLAREGHPVLMHGCSTEDARVPVPEVLAGLGIAARAETGPVAGGEVAWLDTTLLSPPLARLLNLRRVLGLRNSGHSLAKLFTPCEGKAVLVSSYTHGEYEGTMGEVLAATASTALLLRGTEGEVVADARRLPAMAGYVRGQRLALREGATTGLVPPPGFPSAADAESTAHYIRDVLAGALPQPSPIAAQVAFISELSRQA